MKLLSILDFIQQQQKLKEDCSDILWKIYDYAEFLKKPLKLGMFVPCDVMGNVLEKPDFWDANGYPYNNNLSQEYCNDKIEQYQKAEDEVIFKGFQIEYLGEDKLKTISTLGGILTVYWWNDYLNEYKLSRGVKIIQDLVEYGLEIKNIEI